MVHNVVFYYFHVTLESVGWNTEQAELYTVNYIVMNLKLK